jgi:hypothetical protein
VRRRCPATARRRVASRQASAAAARGRQPARSLALVHSDAALAPGRGAPPPTLARLRRAPPRSGTPFATFPGHLLIDCLVSASTARIGAWALSNHELALHSCRCSFNVFC